MTRPLTTRWGAVLALLLAAVVSLGAEGDCFDEEEIEKEAQVREHVAQTAPPPSVTAAELGRAYAVNEFAADQRFGGQVLDVRGRVAALGRDSFGVQPYVSLDGTVAGITIDCTFAERHVRQLATIRVGELLTMRGKNEGLSFGAVNLRGCRILR